ncbi:protein DpdI [Serratia fonticola]|uniref:protein DpdI n=1 Tax=Serratia fonticola TaxID=47917 RepID=UPI0034C66C8F
MTTLKMQLARLREQFNIKQQVKSMETVYEQYRAIRDGLMDIAEPLQKVRSHLGVVKALPVPFSDVDLTEDVALLHGAKANLETLMIRFSERGENIEQEGLGETLAILEGVRNRVNEKVATTWHAFVADLEARAALAPVFLEQQKTLGYTMTYNNYRTALDNFNRQKVSGPDSLKTVKSLQGYCEEMVAMKSTMVFDAPDEVITFFDALDRHHQASLTLLTPGVIAWLEEKELLPTFNVTRKRMI